MLIRQNARTSKRVLIVESPADLVLLGTASALLGKLAIKHPCYLAAGATVAIVSTTVFRIFNDLNEVSDNDKI